MANFYASYPFMGGAGTGTVTSVGLADGSTAPIYAISGSPVTSTGTLTFTLDTQSENLIFAGPSSGSAAQPSFRSLVSSDIPNLAYISTTLGATATSGGMTVSGNTLSAAQSSGSANGWLSSTDWNTFNNKQASGNYITALTGDATASGPGSVALTLATVNSNIGTFASVTVNAKGLVTAAAALSGDATTSGAALTLATVNGNVGSFGSSTSIPSFTVNAKGLITAASGNAVVAPAGTLSGTTLNSTVVSSSLTAVGTIGTGIWQGTAIATSFGGLGGNFGASTGALSISSGTVSAGVLSVANGGTDNGSLGVTAGGVIYTDGTKLQNTGAGSSGQFLQSNGSSAPTWAPATATYTAPTLQSFLSTGTPTGRVFTVSSANATVGATYTNNSVTYTVLATISSGTTLFVSGTGSTSGGALTKASGTGDATIIFSSTFSTATYTAPTSPAPLYIRVKMVGDGGGGGATDSGTGGTGTGTFFGTNLLIANGGVGAAPGSNTGAVGGSSTINSGAKGLAVSGGAGGGAANVQPVAATTIGGIGGSSALGGNGGTHGAASTGGSGGAGATNTGGGGGGASAGNNFGEGGPGGGAGGYIEALITTVALTYFYAVGTGGAGGVAGGGTGSFSGGAGGSGVIIVEEFYQ